MGNNSNAENGVTELPTISGGKRRGGGLADTSGAFKGFKVCHPGAKPLKTAGGGLGGDFTGLKPRS